MMLQKPDDLEHDKKRYEFLTEFLFYFQVMLRLFNGSKFLAKLSQQREALRKLKLKLDESTRGTTGHPGGTAPIFDTDREEERQDAMNTMSSLVTKRFNPALSKM